MKKIACFILCLVCLFSLTCCKDDEDTVHTLSVPVVTIDEQGTASWEPVEGAISYEYKIDDGDARIVDASICKVLLLAGESICVRALGDNEVYLDSQWSENVTFGESNKLATPKVTKAEFGDSHIKVSWELDPLATSYEYRLNSSSDTPLEKGVSSFLIGKGDTFYVRAKGNEKYIDSDWAIVRP